MDEARQVIARLERIDALRAARAAPSDLVAELRELVRDGQAWLAAERAGEGDEPARRSEPVAVAAEPPGQVPTAEPPGPVPVAAEPKAGGNAALRAASALEALDRALAGGERRASSDEARGHEG